MLCLRGRLSSKQTGSQEVLVQNSTDARPSGTARNRGLSFNGDLAPSRSVQRDYLTLLIAPS